MVKSPGMVRNVSTGRLPSAEEVRAIVAQTHDRFAPVTDGTVAGYIPALATTDPALFGIALAGSSGARFSVGDSDEMFSIQSVSKPFVMAVVAEDRGVQVLRQRIGVNSTGLPFDSVMAIELNEHRTMNPLVNAGAIATTSLVSGTTVEDRWNNVLSSLSRFAGRDLSISEDVYASEVATNERNRGIAHLLAGYGCLYSEAADAIEVYTRQCSLMVSASDLAVMGATLASGGTNPISGEYVVSQATSHAVLAALATAGLYESSGDWLYDVGMPGKSGVSGAIITIAPGKGGVATFSPPLDEAGNSVRGQLATQAIAQKLGLSLFASEPSPRQP